MTGEPSERTGQALEDFEDLFENAPCGYVSARADGRIIKANLTFARWLGRERDQLIGLRFQELLNIAGKIFYETHFAPLLRMQGFFNEVALDLVRADGSRLPALVNAVERRDPAGDLRFVRITVFNASDRRRYERELLEAGRAAEKANAELMELNRTLEQRIADAVESRLQAEEALRQAQKMEALGQLTGGIAHDFNNMLAIVISALNLLERRIAQGQPTGSYVAAARNSASRAAALTQRLLAFSRRQPLAPRPLDVNQMVSEVAEVLKRTLGETVQQRTSLAEGLWLIQVDVNQLENALINLAVNARDAMPEGGALTVETANVEFDAGDAEMNAVAPGQYVMIAVTDTGVGMTPEVKAKAFEPFFTTKGIGKGTGLGLSQIFGFVKQSNGHVAIESEIGHGTTIRIYFPRYVGSEAPAHQVRTDFARGSNDELILVVDDEEQVLDFTGQLLRELGYGTLQARGGTEALQKLAAHPEIRLLLTDVVMEDMSGRQLAENALRLRPGLRVLFTSGYAPSTMVRRGLLDDGTPFLQKPASLDDLSAKVREVLDE